MKKIFLLMIFFLNVSCYQLFENANCVYASESDYEMAKWLYENGSPIFVSFPSKEVKDLFGCRYRSTDYVYSFNTMWRSGYLLVRNGYAIAFVDAK